MNFRKSQFLNEAIENSLRVVDKLPILEELLHQNIQQFKQLQKFKVHHPQNFMVKVKSEGLFKLLHEVSVEVDGFLDFEHCKTPKIVYYRRGFFYDNDEKLITVAPLRRTSLIPGIAHEYAHYIHYRKGLGDLCYDLFAEGHARGVERHIAEEYKEKEDNEAFLYDILEETACELKYAYIWVCKELDKKPKKSLLKVGDKGKIFEHDLGNAFFSIYETLYGKDVYKETLNCG